MLRHRKGQPSDGGSSLWWIVEHTFIYTFIYMGRRGAFSGGSSPLHEEENQQRALPFPP